MDVEQWKFDQLRQFAIDQLGELRERIEVLEGRLAVTDMATQALIRAGSAPGEVLHRVFEQFVAQQADEAQRWSATTTAAASETLDAIRRQAEEVRLQQQRVPST